MLNIKKLRYKNFLSVGNKWMEYDFQENEIYLIKGKNGAGKSIIIDALTFGLYGRPHRKINLGELVNKINQKELVVEVEFEIGNNQYKVVRGLDPGIFEIYINGKKQRNDADRRHQQKTFEQTILKMDRKTFKQLVVLGSKSYKPFMTMGRAERTLIIEDLLNIGIYGTMYNLLKGKASYIEGQRSLINERLTEIENSIDTNKEYLERTIGEDNQKQASENKDKLQKLIAQKRELEAKNEQIQATIQNLRDELNECFNDGIEKELKKLARAKDHLIYKKKDALKELEFFENNENCPTCHRDINPEFQVEMIEKNRSISEEKETDIQKCTRLIDERQKKVDKMKEIQNSISENEVDEKMQLMEIENLEKRIKETQKIIEKEEKRTKEDVEFIRGKLKELQEKRDQHKEDLQDISEKNYIYDHIFELLKSGGIKKKIIKAYVPLINKLIRKYLDVMEFNVDFRFDEDFNETIKVRGRDDYTYGGFSEGEKLRIDLCLLFTWREISRMKNNAATNVIIFDEIGDSSLDEEGFDCFMRILGSDKIKQCAIIISHKTDVLENRVNRVYEYSKVGNFTELQKTQSQDIEQSIL